MLASNQGVAPGTYSQQSGCFARWCKFQEDIGIDNRFLDGLDNSQRTGILSAFCESVRRNENRKRKLDRLAGDTVKATLTNVCLTIWSSFWVNPAVDDKGAFSLTLKKQLHNYRQSDPPTKHQKALPTIVFKKIWQNKLSQKNIALSELITGALFFGMRSCEYSTTSGKRKTKKLEVKDIYFYLGRKEIKKTKENLHSLHSATSVSVTFTLQKNNQRYATITQHRSGNEVDPVSLWAALVKGILSYKTRSLSSPVYLYMSDTEEIRNISLKDVAAHLKAMVSALGENYLGFTSEYVGTHSIRSSFAMMLKLKGIHPSTIMLQGRVE